MPEDEKYDVLEKIGHGSFGIIRKVKRKSDGYILCRKEISYSKMSAKEREQLQAELSILKELHHPNIVAYFERDHIKQSQDLHLYMEYCGNGDLGRVIRDLKNKNQLAEEEFIWSIFSQIVSALYRCHYGEDPPAAGQNVLGLGAHAKPGNGKGKPMILHRDLKPENIFLGNDNSVKLGDFGLSKILQSHDFASTYVGTPFYMSPEICKAEQYTLHSDIWALGCIMYEMCARAPPFNAKTHFELIQKIKLGRYTPIPACYSAELGKVIASCLQTNPNTRPDTAQLLNLPVVKLMRKEQEVVRMAHELKEEKLKAALKMKEAENMIIRSQQEMTVMRKELDSSLRREWEVKARLAIDEQVSAQMKTQMAALQAQFEDEVQRRVKKILDKHPRISTSPRLAPRSNTPTMPAELFPNVEPAIKNGSTSTLGTASDFLSGTDISSISLDDAAKELPKPAKRSQRAPLSRARTMFTGHVAALPPPSPMDVQMVDPSPAPAAAIASLSLSPRRGAQRSNLFTAKARKSSRDVSPPPSPTDEEWNGDFDDDEDTHILPSPTRARSSSGGKPNNEDPFKVFASAQRPLLKAQRLGSTPSLAPTTTKPRPQSAVPIVATSPSRPKSKLESFSPTRKTVPTKPAAGSGLVSKKGNEQMRMMAMRNNGLQGRTLVELQQARGIPTQAMSEDEGVNKKLGAGIKAGGFRSPVKARSANGLVGGAAIWDPEVEEMPSPFLKRGTRMIK
ncbi:G2-specific protein kinase-like protein nimA [Amniculicola lignicola CBS 123094]|uniref:non-specific serine/threonine protein kinase n=1 Tax=Amniculicola lignicola CBS 123094 TaxID=1392246 RepID=A0A6A5W7D9_9PLEO|nr:G2-specific protein kinase-like protein nimA [Amniculicola lignicola CBS 123094]